jgi:hypothetical protein
VRTSGPFALLLTQAGDPLSVAARVRLEGTLPSFESSSRKNEESDEEEGENQ